VDGKVRCWPISGDGLAPAGPDYYNRIIAEDDFSALFRPEFPYVAPALRVERWRANRHKRGPHQ
jgi:hypothetical protein